jgi:hypothetical protein
MTTSDIERRPDPDNGVGARGARSGPVGEGRAAPARPSLSNKEAAPVLVKLPAPASVRLSQLAWVLSLAVSAVAVVYLFIIREQQLPEIVTVIKGVDESRADATYDTAADILYWSVFAALVALWLVQVTLLVSFSNRRPNIRWWLLGTVLFQGAVFLVCRELVALGERGIPLTRVQLLALALAVLGLLFSALPAALHWTARKHDVARSSGGSSGGDL